MEMPYIWSNSLNLSLWGSVRRYFFNKVIWKLKKPLLEKPSETDHGLLSNRLFDTTSDVLVNESFKDKA
jgi:hypothetical protein